MDPAARKVVARIKIGPQLWDVEFAAGSVWATSVTNAAVWVANRIAGTVTRINPRTNRIVARIKVGLNPSNPAIAADGTVFVPNNGSGTVSRIDPATNRVVQTLRVGGGPFPSTSAFGDVWVPDFRGDSIFRIDVP